MKSNKKMISFAFIIAVFLLATSCGITIYSDAHSTENNTQTSDTINTGIISSNESETADETFFPWHSETPDFKGNLAVIAEFGEIISSVNSNGSAQLYFFADQYGSKEIKKYVARPIKINKIFEATTSEIWYEDIPTLLRGPFVISNIYPERLLTELCEYTDFGNKNQILSEYDDIVLFDTAYPVEITACEEYLIFFDTVYDVYIDESHPSEDGLQGWEKTPSSFMIPIKDGKICLPDNFFDFNTSWLGDTAKKENYRLKQYGLTDNLFRDGMTIEELEDYFNLVTDLKLRYG